MKTGTRCARLSISASFKLLVSTNANDKCHIIHPFVDCFVDEVRVRALTDSGSMKFFISQPVQRTIDFDDRKLNKLKKAKCVSMTGHNVNIQGHLSSAVKFLGTRAQFNGNFLVSKNIPYECALGWDFISQNNLPICQDVYVGNCILVGKHGATPIINSQSSITGDRVGVVESNPQIARVNSQAGRLFCQSRFQGNTGVSLVESVMIPPRTEIILEGKLAKRGKSSVGMLEPRSSSSNARY